jgi:orotate phosphoribosyltransferase
MPAMSSGSLAARIHERAVLTGSFVLRSGRTATEYFDKYRFESDPALLSEIAVALEPLVPPATEVLAGLELGGVPIAVALSLRTGIPACFVRHKAKDYGTRRLAEGCDIDGRRLTVIEDVVTTGGQVIQSTADLRALGAIVEHAVCVIDRQAGGADGLRGVGVSLLSLLTATAA